MLVPVDVHLEKQNCRRVGALLYFISGAHGPGSSMSAQGPTSRLPSEVMLRMHGTYLGIWT